MPSPLMMPLVRGELVGLVWVRPLHVGQDAVAGIAELANIAAAAGADEVVLAGHRVRPGPRATDRPADLHLLQHRDELRAFTPLPAEGPAARCGAFCV